MPTPYELEVLNVKHELLASLDEVMRLVRQGKAFGPEWTSATERHRCTLKKWRRVIARPSMPALNTKR